MRPSPIQTQTAAIRDIMLATIIAAFVIGGIVAASVSAENHYARQDRIEQETTR